MKRIPVFLSSLPRAPLYPFLVAALPVIRFYGRNFRLLPMRDNLPLVFIYWLVTALLLAGGRMVWKSWSRAALVLVPLLAVLFSGQARYIMKRLGETVDRILAASPRPPVIIIQGDHGPGSELDWDRPRQTNHNERMGIYNAWLTPPGIEPALYEGMTAVNTFPLLFNAMTGADLPLRPDEAWFATMKNPYIFHSLKFE